MHHPFIESTNCFSSLFLLIIIITIQESITNIYKYIITKLSKVNTIIT